MQQSPAPDLHDLQAFIVLGETGSFVATGRRLGRDPTAISRRLQHLEDQLGVRLAERTTRQVLLTEAGRTYLARVRPLFDELSLASREVAALGEGEAQGRLRLTLPGSFARLWLSRAIIEYARAHPRVVVEADYTNKVVDLISGGYDLAVRLAVLPDSRLVARKVAERQRIVVASPEFLAAHGAVTRPQDLSGLAALCFTGREHCYRWSFKGADGSAAAIDVRCGMASDEADLLVEAAIGGLGVFYTTDWHVAPHLASGRLVRLLPDWTIPDAGGVYLVFPASANLPAKTRTFADWIAKSLSPAPWTLPSRGL